MLTVFIISCDTGRLKYLMSATRILFNERIGGAKIFYILSLTNLQECAIL